MITRKLFLATLVSVLTCASAFLSVAQEPVLPFTYMYDTGAHSAKPLTSSAISRKSNWIELEEDDTQHQFKGDTVLVNNRIVVVVRKNGAGAEVYMLTGKKPAYRATLVPEGSVKAASLTLVSLKINENNPSGADLRVVYKADREEIAIGYRLTPGEPMVTVSCDSGLKKLKAIADISYVLVPNFFADDMIFAGTSFDVSSVPLPTEKMFLNMITGGDSIMMFVCEDDAQDCRVVFAGSGANRVIAAPEVLAVKDKKIWVAFLDDKGIWAEQSASATHPLKWTAPFSARWRINVLKEAGLAESFPYTEALTSKNMGSQLLVYPLERNGSTPGIVYCMRDIMKNTLGLGPCEYIISVEGLSDATPHEVTEGVKRIFRKKRDVRKADNIKKRFVAMVKHIKHAQERIDKYEIVANKIKAVCANEQKVAPESAKLIETIDQLANGINQGIVMKKEALAACEFGAEYSDKIVGLIGKKNVKTELVTLSAKIQHIGDSQDKALAKCRMSAKWLGLQCKELKLANSQSEKFLQAVDELIQTMLVK